MPKYAYKDLIIPIYYAETDEGEKILDEDTMRDELEEHLKTISKNFKKEFKEKNK